MYDIFFQKIKDRGGTVSIDGDATVWRVPYKKVL